MRKPEGYEQSEAVEGGFRSPSAGPCIIGITRTQVEVKNGEQRIVLYCDIAEGEFKNYYRRQSEKWNKNRYLRYYQKTEGKSLPYFKGIITTMEKENSFVFDWNEASLHFKKTGANLQEEEYRRTDGSIGTVLRIAYLCSMESVHAGQHKVLPIKKLKEEPQEREPGMDDIPPDEYDQSQHYEEQPQDF